MAAIEQSENVTYEPEHLESILTSMWRYDIILTQKSKMAAIR